KGAGRGRDAQAAATESVLRRPYGDGGRPVRPRLVCGDARRGRAAEGNRPPRCRGDEEDGLAAALLAPHRRDLRVPLHLVIVLRYAADGRAADIVVALGQAAAGAVGAGR